MVITGKTSSGYKYKINDWALTDWETCEAICDIESSDPSVQLKGTRKLAILLLGEDGLEKLKDHIRKTNNGHVPFQIISDELTEIMSSNKETKNS